MPSPFDVDPDAIRRLGPAFAPFINDLLEAERAAGGIAGYALDINWQVNTADGGVDAGITGSGATSWLPSGDSVWQFKSGDLQPQECRDELRNGDRARSELGRGATYVLVLGRPLVKDVKDARRDALVEEATALGLQGASGLIRVYDGNQLARWVSSIAGLALDLRLGGPGPVLMNYNQWRSSREHRERWVRCESRADVEEAVVRLARGELEACRLEGGGGLGKTRLVMEALGQPGMATLVGYAPRGDHVTPDLLSYLQQPDRVCVLVVDNCTDAHHRSISEQISSESLVRLISVGREGTDPVRRDPVFRLAPATDNELEAILHENVGGLWTEARRVVKESCFGNVGTALMLGHALVDTGEVAVADLLRREGVKGLLLKLLPERGNFFASAILALFERVGWDRDRRSQLETLSSFAGISNEELEATARELEGAGLFERQGRYRAVRPQPVAVFLAADAWERMGDRILTELLPLCDREMAEGLFRRCAELGRFGPARQVLNTMLSPSGELGSLDRLEGGDLGELVVQLAVILPEETTTHLSELIEGATIESLSGHTRSRRDLVRALEKLAWHGETFSAAADCLLRLALAENESWANNATGQWVALFGARLPATSAAPTARIEYLWTCLRRGDQRVRLLAVEAVSSALHFHEPAMVSAEVQGGAIVAPRGSVRPGQEALDYWTALVSMLDEAAADNDLDVRAAARSGLRKAIHPFIDAPQIGQRLAEAVLKFEAQDLRELRRDLEHLIEIVDEGSALEAALRELHRKLPQSPPLERLRGVLESRAWDWEEEDGRIGDLRDLVGEVEQLGQLDEVLRWLSVHELPSAGYLGRILAERRTPGAERALVDAAETNPSAITGWLDQLVKAGDVEAFDRLIDGELGDRLSAPIKLSLTTIGPRTDSARHRVITLLGAMPVMQAAGRLARWKDELSIELVGELLERWNDEIRDVADYAAVIHFLRAFSYPEKTVPDDLHPRVLRLLELRRDHPNLEHERWGWCGLAAAVAGAFPSEIASLIFDLVRDSRLMLMDTDHEAAVLGACVHHAPEQVWSVFAARMEAKEWRLSMVTRGWLAAAFPVSVIERWVGDSLERARLVADIAPGGAEQPSELAVYLLSKFEDDEIAGALAGEYQSGSWVGPWSSRLQMQIDQLAGWRKNVSLPLAVRTWAARVTEALERQREAALEREAEERW